MSFETIHNYYERLVLERISELATGPLANENEDFLCDVACVTLNQLPSRYVRHNVDMVFYMPVQERERIQIEVDEAVNKAIDYVNDHRGEKRPQTISQ